MIDFLVAYRPLFDVFLLHTGYALGQYIVLRAGVFSIANAGLSAIGAYLAAGLTLKLGLHPYLSLIAATAAGTFFALLLSWPLARLRGVYQAIATLAFVQVVLSLNIYADSLTGGAMGLNGIPKIAGTSTLLVAAIVTIYIMTAINATRLGRAFDAIRQDEAVAISLGVSVRGYQSIAFAISGAVAGLFGGLEAFHGYALEPNQFGFSFLVAALSYVVLGGRRSVIGPVVGTAILVALPEISRPLAEYRMLVYGMLLMAVIAFLPRGVVDTWLEWRHKRRVAADDGPAGSLR
ncbi:MAG: branched-chain amino acid transport system permease protein [Bradyrhizobium sp.]|jgi:branched-chain amino acid transport system permease protein|nr:branched-chain amino acid transport system permease protein [Bradyrhizobium sp.]